MAKARILDSHGELCNVQRRGWEIEMGSHRIVDRRPDQVHIDDRWSGAGVCSLSLTPPLSGLGLSFRKATKSRRAHHHAPQYAENGSWELEESGTMCRMP